MKKVTTRTAPWKKFWIELLTARAGLYVRQHKES